jgi:2-keto-4-pentenoate hydratase/2-oxohepta-3-ene-1,7-dioic acid hydratase in catechol pathway
MRLVTFEYAGVVEYGTIDGEEIRVVSREPGCPRTLRSLLAGGRSAMQWVEEGRRRAAVIPLSTVRLLPPIPDPRKFLCVGGNYQSHLDEAARRGISRGTGQVWFNKQVSCVAGPYDVVHRPRISVKFDYEGELGVVIGQRCRNVPRTEAAAVVAGYVVCNDLSVRDWQMRAPTGTLGKSFDTHGPFGPWLVTAEEIPDPQALTLRTSVNGQVRQSASTREMIHDVGALIEELTTAVTLEPGDILATGTPAGVGGLMTPPQFLVAGDRVRVEIDGIGYIENLVIEEPPPLGPLMPSVAPIVSW